MKKLKQHQVARRPVRRLDLNSETIRVLGTGPVATTTPDPANTDSASCDNTWGLC